MAQSGTQKIPGVDNYPVGQLGTAFLKMRACEGIYAAWIFVHFQLNSDGLYSQKSVTQTQPKKGIEWVG